MLFESGDLTFAVVNENTCRACVEKQIASVNLLQKVCYFAFFEINKSEYAFISYSYEM